MESRLQEKINSLSEDAKQELRDSLVSIERDADYLEGRLNRFKILFDKNITLDEYKILLNKILLRL